MYRIKIHIKIWKELVIKFFTFLIFMSIITLNAKDVNVLAKKLELYAGTKASIQWERIFSSPRHMKRYKLDALTPLEATKLKQYLIKHSADSDQPIVPGL